MTELDFDHCPECGALPIFGLRCHPKFSVKAGIKLPNGGLDLVAYYAHDVDSALVLYNMLENDHLSDVISLEQWSGPNKKWLEIDYRLLYFERSKVPY